MKVGEIVLGRSGPIVCNEGRTTRTLRVVNSAKYPIRVSSHYPFFEVNKDLVFDRSGAFGYRLNIPAGYSLLFLPQEEKTVELVEIAGKRQVWGFNGLTNGSQDPDNLPSALQQAQEKGFIKEGFRE